MKILIIHRGFPINHIEGDGVRTLNMAKSLNELGHYVIILMLYNVMNFKFRNLRLVNKEGNILHLYIPTLPTSKLLNLSLLYDSIIVWLVACITKINVIQAEISWSATITRFVSHIPLVTDFHSDLVPELEATNRSLNFIKKVQIDNGYALNKSKHILCVSQTLHDNICKSNHVFFPSNILPCSVNFNVFSKERLYKRNDLRSYYGLTNRIVIAYLGGTHSWQCLNETFDIFIRLRNLNSNYFFCLFTNASISSFTLKIDSLEDSFMTMPLVSDNLVEHLSMIDAGFVIRDNMVLNLNSSPTKIGEYMACGAMVIATQYSGDAPELIKRCGYGVILNSTIPSDNEIKNLDEKIQDYVNHYLINSNRVRQFIEYSRDWSRNKEILEGIYIDIENSGEI